MFVPVRSSFVAALALVTAGCGSSSGGLASPSMTADDEASIDEDAGADAGTSDGPVGTSHDAATENDATTGSEAGPMADAAHDAPDSAATYDPCPAPGTACRIMPLGDSITYGYQSPTLGGYRAPMFDTAVKAGKSITFVGSQVSGPSTVAGMPFPQGNEGYPGYTIADGGGRMGIQALVQTEIATYQPHIVTLMIGTNDVDIQLDLANAPKRLGTLLDTILAADPDLLLVVAQITPTQDDTENMRVRAYNAAIPALVTSRAKAGKHIVLVDMYGAITADASYKTDYLANALHPNDDGFAVIAGVWEAAIGAFFK